MEFLKRLFGKKARASTDEVMAALKQKVSGLSRPAVRLIKSEEPGKSRLGGKPLADSKDFLWPESGGKPMAFLARIELEEIAQAVQFDWLPKSGTLLFFYDIFEMPWGFDPNDRGKWCVLYQEQAVHEIDHPDNLPDEAIIKEISVSVKKEMVLPDLFSPEVDSLHLSDEESDLYTEIKYEGSEEMPMHQVGGFPAPVQGNDMELEAQLASNGVYVGEPEGYESDEARKLEGGAGEWRLLFQFDSDEELGIMWGDCGMLYFWVRKEEAGNYRFDNTWLILQCG